MYLLVAANILSHLLMRLFKEVVGVFYEGKE